MHPTIGTPISSDETTHLINLFIELFYYLIGLSHVALVGTCGASVLFLLVYYRQNEYKMRNRNNH